MSLSNSKSFSQRLALIHSKNGNQEIKDKQPLPTEPNFFPFSNRKYSSSSSLIAESEINRSTSTNVNVHRLAKNLGRTTTPVSSFILQKNAAEKMKSESSSNETMNDEVQFVRPYFGPSKSQAEIQSSLTHKRDVLLSALNEIEFNLKTL